MRLVCLFLLPLCTAVPPLVEGDDGVKLIGAGFGRTGTSSTMQALELLDIGKVHHMIKVIEGGHSGLWADVADAEEGAERQSALRKALKGFAATVDFPSCSYYKELMRMYPDAKVLLTTRSPESWYKSAWATILFCKRYASPLAPGFFDESWVGPGMWAFTKLTPMGWTFSRMINGAFFMFDGVNTEQEYIEVFRAWEAEVEATVPADRLLKFSVKDGWEPLAKFVGKPVPDVPFPHVNDKEEFQKNKKMIAAVGYAFAFAELGLLYLIFKFGRRWICGSPKAKRT